MKKNVLILFIFIIAAMGMPSAVHAIETASQVLDKCFAKLNSAPSLNVNFVLKFGEKTSTCTMIVEREKFRLASNEMEVWYDGMTQWTYVGASQELSITEPTDDELLESNPFTILNNYMQSYNCRRIDGQELQIELIAKNKRQAVRKAVITIDPATTLPSKLIVTMRNGQFFFVDISSIERGKSLPESTFIYDEKKYPAKEINDLR